MRLSELMAATFLFALLTTATGNAFGQTPSEEDSTEKKPDNPRRHLEKVVPEFIFGIDNDAITGKLKLSYTWDHVSNPKVKGEKEEISVYSKTIAPTLGVTDSGKTFLTTGTKSSGDSSKPSFGSTTFYGSSGFSVGKFL